MRDGLGRGLVYIVLEKNNQNKKMPSMLLVFLIVSLRSLSGTWFAKLSGSLRTKVPWRLMTTARSLVIASKTCFA